MLKTNTGSLRDVCAGAILGSFVVGTIEFFCASNYYYHRGIDDGAKWAHQQALDHGFGEYEQPTKWEEEPLFRWKNKYRMFDEMKESEEKNKLLTERET